MFINLNHGVLEWLCKNNGKLTQNRNTCCVSKCMANSKCCDKASFSVNEKFLSRAGREKLPVLSVWDRFMKLKTDFILERKQRKSVHKKVFFFFSSKLVTNSLHFIPVKAIHGFNLLSCLILLCKHVLGDTSYK